MTLEITAGFLIATFLLLGISVYKQRQPKDIDSPWGIPWTFVMFASILGALILLAHLLSFL
ncbi:MAG: hypothetical protein P8P98_05550 [Emcibacteraceae bacterium]|nr:hypothetical protein [Emcibacteraceae bacterium]MDG1996478.1 hypothetical protein [Emcibacteraceae bacterium]